MTAASRVRHAFFLVFLQLLAGSALVPGSAAAALGPADIAVVINQADPLSRAIGEYYRGRRRIPAANVIVVRFPVHGNTMTVADFAALRHAIDAATPSGVQAYALAWVRPYRVDCMSMTAAIASGFDPGYCSYGCQPTRFNPYFGSDSARPYDDFRLRPAMMLAATDFAQARALIDRGVAADGTLPAGTAYLVTTADVQRNVRALEYADASRLLGRRFPVRIVDVGTMHGIGDVMFYFVGAARVADPASNRFLPGAVADHLTSYGGELFGTSQMSSLDWLRAGATGSYGTVAEPCNYTAKFPNVGQLMRHYLDGDTLIEAYWKSVAMPGQGLFIGEPLARPFAR